MQGGEGLECSFTCEELEATLRVPNPLHTEEPHQEVEAIHEEGTKHRSLKKKKKTRKLVLKRKM